MTRDRMGASRFCDLTPSGRCGRVLAQTGKGEDMSKNINKSYPEMSRNDLAGLLANGWQFKPAHLYEPQHAPKGTQFVHVTGPGFIRLYPPIASKGITKL
jgi:hypothetical protein